MVCSSSNHGQQRILILTIEVPSRHLYTSACENIFRPLPGFVARARRGSQFLSGVQWNNRRRLQPPCNNNSPVRCVWRWVALLFLLLLLSFDLGEGKLRERVWSPATHTSNYYCANMLTRTHTQLTLAPTRNTQQLHGFSTVSTRATYL